MSIIYEALKKAEKQNPGPLPAAKPGEKPRVEIKVFLLYTLVIVLGFFITNFLFIFLSPSSGAKSASGKSALAAKTLQAASPQFMPEAVLPGGGSPASAAVAQKGSSLRESLSLNGIFFSDGQYYALIDNQVVKEGDAIQGAVVKQITVDEVELETDGTPFKLSTAK